MYILMKRTGSVFGFHQLSFSHFCCKSHDDVIRWIFHRVTCPFVRDFPSQRPVTRSFGVVFDPRLNRRLSKQSSRRWFETSSLSLWRHCNAHATFNRLFMRTAKEAIHFFYYWSFLKKIPRWQGTVMCKLFHRLTSSCPLYLLRRYLDINGSCCDTICKATFTRFISDHVLTRVFQVNIAKHCLQKKRYTKMQSILYKYVFPHSNIHKSVIWVMRRSVALQQYLIDSASRSKSKT